MARTTFQANNRTYDVALDDAVSAGRRLQVIVGARLIDECTGDHVQSETTVRCAHRGLTGHVGSDGFVGLVGIPGSALSALATRPYRLVVEFSAEGYLSRQILVPLGPQPTFLDDFLQVPLGDIPMHPHAVIISGRVFDDDGATRTPVAGATIGIREFWPMLPTAAGGVPQPPNLLAIAPPLYAARELGATVRRRGTVVMGSARRLTRAATAGQPHIDLEPCPEIQILPDHLVEIEFTDPVAFPRHDPVRTEYLAITKIDRVHNTLPARLTLAHSLAFDHARDVRVRLVSLDAPGAALSPTREALAGEECLFTNALTDLAGAATVAIDGGLDLDGNALSAEFHRVHLFSTVSDANGFFRLPPLSRVAQVTLEATIGADVLTRTFNPDYELHENRADFVRAV